MSESPGTPTGGEQFTCDLCGETFDKEWTDEEAAAEYAEKFPHEAALGAATGVVCEDCWQKSGLGDG